MRRRAPIHAAVIHMHMHIAAHPVPLRRDRPESIGHRNGKLRRVSGADIQVVTLQGPLEAVHDFDSDCAGGHVERRIAQGVKIMRLETTLLAIESIVGVDPRIRRRVEQSGRIGNADARGGGQPITVAQRNMQLRSGIHIVPLIHVQGPNRAARDRRDFDLGVSAAIGDEGNARAIGRPARIHLIPITERDRERIAAASGQYPQIMPGATYI